jgi:hypothetical protein
MVDQPSPRPRFQFRLSTLLIVVTLLAAQCAFVTWVIRDRQRLIRERDGAIQKQRQLLEALQMKMSSYYYGITKAAESGTQP